MLCPEEKSHTVIVKIIPSELGTPQVFLSLTTCTNWLALPCYTSVSPARRGNHQRPPFLSSALAMFFHNKLKSVLSCPWEPRGVKLFFCLTPFHMLELLSLPSGRHGTSRPMFLTPLSRLQTARFLPCVLPHSKKASSAELNKDSSSILSHAIIP